VGFKCDAGWVRPAAHSCVERVDRGDLVAGEFKVKDLEILGDASGLRRLRDRRTTLLQMPPQHYLSGGLAMLARDLHQDRIIEGALLTTAVGRDAANGRPGLSQDASLGV